MHFKECGKSFSASYFSRHQFARDFEEHGTSSKENDIEWKETDLEQGENNNFMNIDISNQNETTGDQVEINDNGMVKMMNMNYKEVSEKVFDKFFEEASFLMRRSHQKVKMAIKGPS